MSRPIIDFWTVYDALTYRSDICPHLCNEQGHVHEDVGAAISALASALNKHAKENTSKE
jgi:hypothetical protein